MAEYIEREAVKDLLKLYWNESAISLMNDIEELPAADVAPVVHGRWIEIERTEYYDSEDKHIDTEVLLRCSACGNRLEIYEGEDGYNYCPRCRTKMNEVTE